MLAPVLLLVGLAGLVVVFHKTLCFESPKLFYTQTEANKALISSVSLFHTKYVFPVWGLSGNLQSLYAAIIRSSSPQPFRREELCNEEHNGTVTIDWVDPVVTDKDDPETIPTVIFIPGIAGSTSNHYVKKQVEKMREVNWRIAVYNHPGCGESKLTHQKVILHGDPRDVRAVVNHVHKLYPKSPLVALGISLGANLVCRYLGEERDNCPLLGAISMSQGFEARDVLDYLAGNPMYNYGLVIKFKAIVKKFKHIFEGIEGLDLERALSSRSLSDFDRHFTQRVHNLPELTTYYDHVSSSNYLGHITTPTLIVNARDDPLFSPHLMAIPEKAVMTNDKLIFCLTEKGGHATWAKGLLFPERFTWGDELVSEWFMAIVAQSKQ